MGKQANGCSSGCLWALAFVLVVYGWTQLPLAADIAITIVALALLGVGIYFKQQRARDKPEAPR